MGKGEAGCAEVDDKGDGDCPAILPVFVGEIQETELVDVMTTPPIPRKIPTNELLSSYADWFHERREATRDRRDSKLETRRFQNPTK